MATGTRQSLARGVRRLARAAAADEKGLSDAELLDRFRANRDEAAFEALVWRHSGLVLGVCRRLLDREQDAEDAFQATFLALVRKAGSINGKASIGAWLYRVAYRAALAMRKRANRHHPLTDVVLDTLVDESTRLLDADLKQILDAEVNRLPERYRVPFVLCCLEGKTVDEAAAELGRPRGTIGSSVSRAKERLRTRLARRGVVLSAASLTLGVESAAFASIPGPGMVRETAHIGFLTVAKESVPSGLVSANVPIITQEILTTMFMTKVKLTALALGCVIGLAMAGVVAHQASATSPAKEFVSTEAPEPEKAPAGSGTSKIDKVPPELEGLRGQVVGKLISADPEKGELVLEIRAVQRVWKNNKAKRPKSAEGKTLRIDGVFGKFLDVLVTLKKGDGVQIEVKHVKGTDLSFLGEQLKKVELPAAKPRDRD